MTKKYTFILAGLLSLGRNTSFGMDPTSPRLRRDTSHAIAPEEQRRMDNSAQSVDNGRALIKAAGREGKLEEFQRLLAITNPNYANERGVTAVHEVTVDTGDTSKLKLLIQAGANVNALLKGSHKTALHYAAQLNRTEAVVMLIEAGADKNIRDHKGRMPIQWAQSKFEETRKAFISTISPQDLLPKLSQILALKNNGAYSQDAGEIIATTILPELIEDRLALIPEICYLKSDYTHTTNPEESLRAILRDAMIASINRVIREAPFKKENNT